MRRERQACLGDGVAGPLELLVNGISGPAPAPEYLELTIGSAREPSHLTGRDARERVGGFLLWRREGRQPHGAIGYCSFLFCFFDFMVHLLRNARGKISYFASLRSSYRIVSFCYESPPLGPGFCHGELMAHLVFPATRNE